MSEVVWHPIKVTEDGFYWPLPDFDDTNEHGDVLVTTADDQVLSVSLEEDESGFYFFDLDFDEIKAWARFPDPYKGDEENAEDDASESEP